MRKYKGKGINGGRNERRGKKRNRKKEKDKKGKNAQVFPTIIVSVNSVGKNVLVYVFLATNRSSLFPNLKPFKLIN